MRRALAALRRLREVNERRAGAEAGDADRRLTEARQRRAEAGRTPRALSQPVSAATARALRAADVWAAERRAERDRVADDAAADRDRAYLRWSEAAAGRRQAERLEERRRREQVARANAARQRALDAAATLRWERRR